MDIGRIFKLIATAALILVGLWLIYVLKSIIALILISAVLAYILDPVASYMEFRGLSRLQATTLIFIILVAIVSLLFYLLMPPLISELTLLQEGLGQSGASDMFTRIEKMIHDAIPVISSYELNLNQKLDDLLQNFSESLFSIAIDLASVLSTAIVVPFAVFFLLKDGRRMRKKLVAIIPNKYFEMSLNLLHKIDLQLGGYLRGQFLDAIIIGLLSIIALWVLGVKYFVLIGVFAGLANMIPYVGPFSGMVIASSVVMLNNGSGQDVLWVLVAFGIIQLIDNIVVQPLVLGRSVNLHPLVIIFAIITGAEFFGVIGMLIAVPATGIIKVLISEIYLSLKHYNLN